MGALGIRKKGYLQVYAPITNENIYTNLWRGPFYGFERAIETFEMTDKPRRIKPVGIYYHVYSASKQAGLKALHKVYAWALTHPLHPVYTSEFIAKVKDFEGVAIAREGRGWRAYGRRPPAHTAPAARTGHTRPAGQYRCRRFPPRGRRAVRVLSGARATLQLQSPTSAAAPWPSCLKPMGAWAAGPVQTRDNVLILNPGPRAAGFALAAASQCQVRANQRALSPAPQAPSAPAGVQYFRLQDARAQVQLHCPAR